VLMGAMSAAVCELPIQGQVPPRVERCLPWPTLGQEIEDFRKEVRELEKIPPKRRIQIQEVVIQGATQMPESVQRELVEALKKRTFEDEDGRWIQEIQEIDVRAVWQERGYFTVQVSVKADVETAGPELTWAKLTIRVEEGRQYRLGEIRFEGATIFSPEELRRLIELKEGDIFNIEKVRVGLEAMGKLYSSKGYVDFTPEPAADVDEVKERVSLVLRMDEQKQYVIGKVEVLGLSPELEWALRSKLKPNEPFDATVIDEFFEVNKAALPADASHENSAEVKRDLKKIAVDLLFDFRNCAQILGLDRPRARNP